MKCHFHRIGNAFIPANEQTSKWLAKNPSDYYSFDVKTSRNYRFHCKFFAMLNECFDSLPESMSDKYPTVERLLDGVKIITGHVHEYIVDGKVIYQPRSIDFNSMSDEDFDVFYNKARHALVNYFLADADSSVAAAIIRDF